MPDPLDIIDDALSSTEATTESASRSGNSRSVTKTKLLDLVTAKEKLEGMEHRRNAPRAVRVRLERER